MTTSDPRADRRDDNPHEHRGLGKRILDAVLGDPAEQRPDGPTADRPADRPANLAAPTPTAADRPAENRAGGVPADYAGEGPRREHASYEQAMRDSAPGGVAQDDRGTGQGGTGQAGYADPREATRDAGHDPSGIAADARRDAGYGAGTGTPTDTRRDAGYDPSQAAADARRDSAAPWDSGYDHPGAEPAGADAVHDLPRTEAAATPGTAGAGRDFVTPAYDPDRDRGYDPQAARTAVETDPAQGPVARNTHRDASHDVTRDTDYVDDPRTGGARDYDPAQDTAYVDPARAEADRTTGRRDDDYDTGRVDADRQDRTGDQPGDRVATEPVDRDRTHTDRADTHRGANTAAAAGAAAATAFGSRDRDRSDRDTGLGDTRSGDTRSGDTRFSDVDDTATVDATDTGRGTPDTGAAGVADEDGASGGRERLVPAERADEYSSRWDALKGDFVDEPRRAVRQADELVGEVLDELQRLFADQRRGLEQSFDHDQASTEDLRLALRRYRSFFDRLLSF